MTALTDDTINRLKDVDIRDVANRLGLDIKRGRGNLQCFNLQAAEHGGTDRRPSLALYPQANPRMFKCFTCNIKGNAIQLVEAIRGVGFRDACEWLAQQYNKPLDRVGGPTRPVTRKNVRTPAPALTTAKKGYYGPLRLEKSSTTGKYSVDYDLDALPYAHLYADLYQAAEAPDSQLVEWWDDRGLSRELLDYYGWRVTTKSTYSTLRAKYDDATLLAAGLLRKNAAGGIYEAFTGYYRYVVPYYVNGLPNAPYNGIAAYLRFRQINAPDRKDGTKPAKYLSPIGSHIVIYGYNSLADWLLKAYDGVAPAPLVISESETDLYALHQLQKDHGGQFYGIALSGGAKSANSQVIRELAELLKPINRRNTIRVVVDKDATGVANFYRAIATMLASLNITQGDVIIAPDGYKDYGALLAAKAGKRILNEAIRR